MSIGYITMEKFRLSEMCEKALKNVKPFNIRLHQNIKTIKDCAETFGVKSEVVVDMKLFNKIRLLAGEV